MSPPLPPSFVDIDTAKKSTPYSVVSVIGRVVDALQPCHSRGSSYVSTFTIKDSEFNQDPWFGFKIKYFNDQEASLPAPGVGDVVILRKIGVKQYQGSVLGLCQQYESAPWVVFSQPSSTGGNFSISCSPGSGAPSPSEKSYATSLFNRGGGSVISQQPRTTTLDVPRSTTISPRSGNLPLGRAQKFSLIKDVGVASFFDLVGQVVKTFSENEKFILYVTDYTSNKALFNYLASSDNDRRDGDGVGYAPRSRRKWPGPFGRMTLQVTLWDPHAVFARHNVREEDFVLLRNVHIKVGHNDARLEGNIHTDRIWPNRIGVEVINGDIDDQHVRDLVRRKMEYWRRTKAENSRHNNDEEGIKRQVDESENLTHRTKIRRKNQQNKKMGEVGQPEVAPSVNSKKNELNSNIKANNPAVPYRSISDILHNESHNNTTPDGLEYRLPFQNLRYRSRLRVVDFFPHNLEDFAVPYIKEYDYLSEVETDDEGELDLENGDSRSVTWEWRFCLLVEDGVTTTQHAQGQPKERMELLVAKADAVFLLKMDAANLKKDPQALAQLREKLFILWGDLEELKMASPEKLNRGGIEASASTKPFACCIKEYGVKAKGTDAASSSDEGDGKLPNFGWERRFGMFGTTIAD